MNSKVELLMVVFTAKRCTSFFLLLPALSWGSVLVDDISLSSQQNYSLKEFCQEMVTHPTPLIEVKSITTVDCMGKKVSVGDFCLIKMAKDPYYIRGYAKSEGVECLSGKKVIFKYRCRKKDTHCSTDAKTTCSQLRTKLAYRLDLIHSSLIAKDDYRQLNCFYESL